RYAAAAALVLAACGVVLVSGSRTGRALPGVSAVPAPAVNGGHASAPEPEALLYRTLDEIGNGRLEAALSEIDRVIQAYPNFRLAHLIKGDLLLARARPISTLGNTSHAPLERIAELREEAQARLARYLHERPRDRVPRYLVQLEPEQKHAFVIDTSKHTLYVFENRGGAPRYLADYYVTIGKNGIDKFVEGDKKTPLGVYHVTGSLPRERLVAMYGKLSELYGSGALPINYPNEWDRRQGRNGYGIWLHGVPFDTYSRPPRASDGCVALTNEDFEAIVKRAQAGVTPVIIASGVEWVAPEAVQSLREEISRAIEAWRRDWESLDTARYLSHYAEGFYAGGLDLARWSQHKHKVNAAKEWVKVRLERVSIFLYPGREDLAVVSFEQDYASSNLSDRTRKRQYWTREGGRWKILYEGQAGAAPIEAPLRTG
ncbi:MAG TPA: L,D-transpeptidase family protein, partial [Burkholderiales bacterium]|nr:L,D-transpeptidase family protein [Burkholderiales bacterium]